MIWRRKPPFCGCNGYKKPFDKSLAAGKVRRSFFAPAYSLNSMSQEQNLSANGDSIYHLPCGILKTLAFLHENNNEELNIRISQLADVICLLTSGPKEKSDFDLIKNPEIQEAIGNVVVIRDYLKELRKP
jgi:hypothetical protein